MLRSLIKIIKNIHIYLLNSIKCDERDVELDEFITKSGYNRFSKDSFYFYGNLFQNRFTNNEINEAVIKARDRFPNVEIYYLSDIYENFSYTHNVTRVEFDSIDNVICSSDGPSIFVCAYESDEKLVKVLAKLTSLDNVFYFTPSKYYPTARYFHRNDIARKVLSNEAQIDLPKFELSDFENIIQAMELTKNVNGDYVEVGVYQGRSAHMALNYMREAKISKTAYLIDIFEGFTYKEAERSSDALWFNSHADTSLMKVETFLDEFNNHRLLRLNIITEEMPSGIKSISLCNIDVDMYEAVIAALYKVAPLVSCGGIIIAEDQGHTPALAGGYYAVCEFLESPLGKNYMPIHLSSGQMYLINMQHNVN